LICPHLHPRIFSNPKPLAQVFSTAELDKLDAEGKRAEDVLRKGVASGFKGLRAKAGNIKSALSAQGRSLDDGKKV
jgi:hypothetical protein